MSTTTSFQFNNTLYPELLRYWYNVLAITGHIKLQEGVSSQGFDLQKSKVTRKFDVESIEEGYEEMPNVFTVKDGFVLLKHRDKIDKMLKSMKDVKKAEAIDMFVHMINVVRHIDFVGAYNYKKAMAEQEHKEHKEHKGDRKQKK